MSRTEGNATLSPAETHRSMQGATFALSAKSIRAAHAAVEAADFLGQIWEKFSRTV